MRLIPNTLGGTMYHNKTETKSQYYNWTQLQIALIALKGQEEAMLTNIMIATLVQNVKLTKKKMNSRVKTI